MELADTMIYRPLLATLLLTAASAAFLMAPSAFHRLTFRAGQKPYLIRLATRQTIIGMALLLLAMNAVAIWLRNRYEQKW